MDGGDSFEGEMAGGIALKVRWHLRSGEATFMLGGGRASEDQANYC